MHTVIRNAKATKHDFYSDRLIRLVTTMCKLKYYYKLSQI